MTETFVDDQFDFGCVFTDYIKFHALAEKKKSVHGRNSGGVLLLVRNEFAKFASQIRVECDNAVVVKINKCVFGLDKDVVLVACYIVPEGGPAYNLTQLKDGILILEENILQAVDKDDIHLIVCGDMNARTANEQANEENMNNFDCFDDDNADDVDHDGNDDDGNNCSVKRSSKDTIINNFGRSLLDFCFLFDLMIVNGACSMDTDGDFTFGSPNGSSVVDYFLVSKDVKSSFDVNIADHLFSWHLPVEMYWRNDCEKRDDSPVSQVGEEKVVWSDVHAEMYKDELNSTEFKECLEKSKDAI